MDGMHELITRDNVSIDFLRQLFDEAYYETSIDTDGDLIVMGTIKHYLRVPDSKRYVRIFSVFRLNEDVDPITRNCYANRVNLELNVVRAYVNDSIFGFDFYVWLEGGVTRKNLILSFKTFSEFVREALHKDKDNVIP